MSKLRGIRGALLPAALFLSAGIGLGLLALPTANAATKRVTFTAPYLPGPQGGDQYNQISNDPATGRIAVIRANPSPGAFSCAGKGGFAHDRLRPKVTGAVSKVTVNATEALLDPYTWINVQVRDSRGKWLGAKTVRGPLAGDAVVDVPITWTSSLIGQRLTIDFGLEVASACPAADGGTLRFASVVVTGSVVR